MGKAAIHLFYVWDPQIRQKFRSEQKSTLVFRAKPQTYSTKRVLPAPSPPFLLPSVSLTLLYCFIRRCEAEHRYYSSLKQHCYRHFLEGANSRKERINRSLQHPTPPPTPPTTLEYEVAKARHALTNGFRASFSRPPHQNLDPLKRRALKAGLHGRFLWRYISHSDACD